MFLCLSERFCDTFLAKKACDRSAHPSAEELFEAGFSHTLGIKSAITRITHPQHSLSKGGGFAKRPQSAAPLAGVFGTMSIPDHGRVLPSLTLPPTPARPPTPTPCEPASAIQRGAKAFFFGVFFRAFFGMRFWAQKIPFGGPGQNLGGHLEPDWPKNVKIRGGNFGFFGDFVKMRKCAETLVFTILS